MAEPESFVERQVAEILEKTNFDDRSFSKETIFTPVYHPARLSFDEEVAKWRRRLFPVGAVTSATLANIAFFHLAPSFYRPDNIYYLGAFTAGAVILGVILGEGFSYYIADENVRQ